MPLQTDFGTDETAAQRLVEVTLKSIESGHAREEVSELVRLLFEYYNAALFWQLQYGKAERADCPMIRNPSVRNAIREATTNIEELLQRPDMSSEGMFKKLRDTRTLLDPLLSNG